LRLDPGLFLSIADAEGLPCRRRKAPRSRRRRRRRRQRISGSNDAGINAFSIA